MKRLLMIILVLTSSALSAVSIRSIRAEDYSGVVCRLVLMMDQDVSFTVNQQGKDFYIAINNFDGQIPAHTLGGTFLNQIESTGDGLKVSSSIQLRYLTMQLSDVKALVIDFLKVTQQKREGLVIAKFLAEKGRLASADREYERLSVDHPNHYDILYYWGELLIQRGSSRAAKKLALIPEYSSYYPAAQELLNPGRRSSLPETIAEETPQEMESAIMQEEAELLAEMQQAAETDQELIEASPQDSIIFAFPPEEILVEKSSIISSMAELASKHILITIIVFVAIFVILACLIFGKSKKPVKKSKPDIQENKQVLDTDVLCMMVNRLLADGWTNREISKELKISLHEVEQIVRRLHFTGLSEDDAKE